MPDVRALREDPALFAAEAHGGRLADWQEADVREAARPGVSCWLWGRQSGKSERMADLGLWAAFRKPGARVLLLSGGGELGARRLLESARAVAARSPLLRGAVADDAASVLRLANDSELRALPASEFAVRGWSADALLVDEAQLMSDELLLAAALPTVAAREGAFVLLAGTAGAAAGAFYDLARRGELGEGDARFSRRVSTLVGGDDRMEWQSPTLVEDVVRALGPVRADAEFRCEWQSGEGSLFSTAELAAVTVDYVADALDGLHGPGGVWAGLDLGLTTDRSAFVALARPAVEGVVDGGAALAVRCCHIWPAGYPLLGASADVGVFADVARSPAVIECLRVDASGMQGGFLQGFFPRMRARAAELGGGRRPPPFVMIEEEGDQSRVLGGWRPPPRDGAPRVTSDLGGVAFSAPMKAGAFAGLRALVLRERLLIPTSATELRRQLLGVRVGLSRSGGETFEAASGGHDDTVDALALALRPYRAHNGAWRLMAADLIDRRPATTGAAGAGDVVRVASGLAVRRRPAWHSMGSAAVTEPEGDPAPPPEPDPKWNALRARLAELEQQSAMAREEQR